MLDGIDVSDAGLNARPTDVCAANLCFSKSNERNRNSNKVEGIQDSRNIYNTHGPMKERQPCGDAGSSSEATSVYSSAVSVTNSEFSNSKDNLKIQDMSDFGARRMAAFKKPGTSNYDNFMNMWSSLRGREKRSFDNSSIGTTCSSSTVQEGLNNIFDENLKRHSLRRAQSFNSELSLNRRNEKSNRSPTLDAIVNETTTHRESSPNYTKDRRVTIAVYDSGGHSIEGAAVSDSQRSKSRSDKRTKVLTKGSAYDTEENLTDCSENPSTPYAAFSAIHPDHKIYTKAILSKNSLKNVLSKLTSTRKSLGSDQTITSSTQSDLDKTSERTPSKLVYTMAKQCTKSLKERIKQIRSEDECVPTSPNTTAINQEIAVKSQDLRVKTMADDAKINNPEEQIFTLQPYEQRSSRIGAKLAATASSCNYQVPSKLFKQSSCTWTEASAELAASKVSPCTSDAKNYETILSEEAWKKDLESNLDDSSGSFEEFDDDNGGGDSYYEKSFEIIEDLLENDIFRDSAIYSDPEDPDFKLNASEVTKNFPLSILNRVSKSPSLRSAKGNSLPRKNSGLAYVSTSIDSKNSSITNENPVIEQENNITGSAEYSVDKEVNQSQISSSDCNQIVHQDKLPSINIHKCLDKHEESRTQSPSPTSSTESGNSASSNSITSDACSEKSVSGKIYDSVTEEIPEQSNINSESNPIYLPSCDTKLSATVYPEKSQGFISRSTESGFEANSVQNSTEISESIFSVEVDFSQSKSSRTSVDIEEITSLSPDNTESPVIEQLSPIDQNSCKYQNISLPVDAITLADSSPTVKSNSNISLIISPVHNNPIKKVPPPVPIKPESVRSKAARNCGSKILGHLKSLEECTKFSRNDNLDTSLDGLKSLNERRRELHSWTDKAKPASSNTNSTNTREDEILSKEYQDAKPGDPVSPTTNSRPPQSPLMSVRKFVSRNVACVASRASRSSRNSVNAKSLNMEASPCETSLKSVSQCSKGNSKLDESSSEEKINSATETIKSTGVTRRKSIKAIGNYISKFNARSSSVPPRLNQRFQTRHASLPSNSLDDPVSSPDSSSSGTESSHYTSNFFPKSRNILFRSSKRGSTKSNSQPSFDLCSPSRRGITCSTSYSSSLCQAPASLPVPQSPDSMKSSDLSSLPLVDGAGEVVIDNKRPKGWVRHVVGRLQELDAKLPQTDTKLQ